MRGLLLCSSDVSVLFRQDFAAISAHKRTKQHADGAAKLLPPLRVSVNKTEQYFFGRCQLTETSTGLMSRHSACSGLLDLSTERIIGNFSEYLAATCCHLVSRLYSKFHTSAHLQWDYWDNPMHRVSWSGVGEKPDLASVLYSARRRNRIMENRKFGLSYTQEGSSLIRCPEYRSITACYTLICGPVLKVALFKKNKINYGDKRTLAILGHVYMAFTVERPLHVAVRKHVYRFKLWASQAKVIYGVIYYLYINSKNKTAVSVSHYHIIDLYKLHAANPRSADTENIGLWRTCGCWLLCMTGGRARHMLHHDADRKI